jgi:hypothetical protein
VTNNGFIGTSITITLNYNRLQQLTIGDCLRLAPFLPGLRVSSLPLCTNDVCLTNPSADDSSMTASANELRVLLQPSADRKQNTPLDGSFVVISVSVVTGTCVNPAVTKPVLSETYYSGFQAF